MWWWDKARQPQPREEPEPEAPPAPPPTLYRVMYPGDLAALKALHAKLFAFDYDIGSFIAALQSDRFISLTAYPQGSSGTLLGCVITTMGPIGAFLDMESDNRSDAAPTLTTANSQTSKSRDVGNISPNTAAQASDSNVSLYSVEQSRSASGEADAQDSIRPTGQLSTSTGTGTPPLEVEHECAGQAGSAVEVTETENFADGPVDKDTILPDWPAEGTGRDFEAANSKGGESANTTGCDRSNVSAEQEHEQQHVAQQQHEATQQQQAQHEHGQHEEAQQQHAAQPEVPQQQQVRTHPALLRWLSEREDERGLYICWLGVSPSAQGRGIGSALLNHALSCAESVGAVHLLLHVQGDNYHAQRFYERHGFRALCLVPSFYELPDSAHTLVDALLMHRKVMDDGYEELDSGSSAQGAGVSGEETCLVPASTQPCSQAATRPQAPTVLAHGQEQRSCANDHNSNPQQQDKNNAQQQERVCGPGRDVRAKHLSSSQQQLTPGLVPFQDAPDGQEPSVSACHQQPHTQQQQCYRPQQDGFVSGFAEPPSTSQQCNAPCLPPAGDQPGPGDGANLSSWDVASCEGLSGMRGGGSPWAYAAITRSAQRPTSFGTKARPAFDHLGHGTNKLRIARRRECADRLSAAGGAAPVWWTAGSGVPRSCSHTRPGCGHARTASASYIYMPGASSLTQLGFESARSDGGAGRLALRRVRHCAALNSAVPAARVVQAGDHRGVLGYRRQCTMVCALKKRLR